MSDDLPSTLPLDVKKAREVVNAKSIGSEFTVLDRKVFNILLGHAYRHLQARPTHRIAMGQLSGLFFDTGRSNRIRESLERLWNQKIAIDYVDEEGNAHEMRCHYLSFDLCHIENGHIVYAFDPLLLRFLRNPKVYSQIQLNTVRKFNTTHALKLYEQMRMFYSRYKPVFSCTLEEAHDFFEIPGDGIYRKRFDTFRQRVIEPAVLQVNELAEFDVGVEYERFGSRVVSMTFTAQPKTPKRMIVAADAAGNTKRRKDGNTVDMFVGATDNEIHASPVLRSDTREQARKIAGYEADIDALLEAWGSEFGGRGVLSAAANESFLSWLTLRVARDTDPELVGLDVDAFYDALVGGD
jgi:hypothetical protein